LKCATKEVHHRSKGFDATNSKLCHESSCKSAALGQLYLITRPFFSTSMTRWNATLSRKRQ